MELPSQLTPSPHPWQNTENPQSYELIKSYAEHPRPTQHMLGIVGGNEVPYKNRTLQVEVESDLRGTTRPNTFCPTRQHLPPFSSQGSLGFVGGHSASAATIQTITRNVPKEKVTVNIVTTPLKQSQMWAYPATLSPEPFTIETCGRPEKY
jgi:hypothetical protein